MSFFRAFFRQILVVGHSRNRGLKAQHGRIQGFQGLVIINIRLLLFLAYGFNQCADLPYPGFVALCVNSGQIVDILAALFHHGINSIYFKGLFCIRFQAFQFSLKSLPGGSQFSRLGLQPVNRFLIFGQHSLEFLAVDFAVIPGHKRIQILGRLPRIRLSCLRILPGAVKSFARVRVFPAQNRLRNHTAEPFAKTVRFLKICRYAVLHTRPILERGFQLLEFGYHESNKITVFQLTGILLQAFKGLHDLLHGFLIFFPGLPEIFHRGLERLTQTVKFRQRLPRRGLFVLMSRHEIVHLFLGGRQRIRGLFKIAGYAAKLGIAQNVLISFSDGPRSAGKIQHIRKIAGHMGPDSRGQSDNTAPRRISSDSVRHPAGLLDREIKVGFKHSGSHIPFQRLAKGRNFPLDSLQKDNIVCRYSVFQLHHFFSVSTCQLSIGVFKSLPRPFIVIDVAAVHGPPGISLGVGGRKINGLLRHARRILDKTSSVFDFLNNGSRHAGYGHIVKALAHAAQQASGGRIQGFIGGLRGSGGCQGFNFNRGFGK